MSKRSKQDNCRNKAWKEWCKTVRSKKYSVSEYTDFGDVTSNDTENVIDITAEGDVLVERCKLRRVLVLRPDGSYYILKELLSKSDAAAVVKAYNAMNPREKAKSIGYRKAYRLAMDLQLSKRRRDRDHGLDAIFAVMLAREQKTKEAAEAEVAAS